MSNKFESTSILKTIYKWKWHLLIIVIIAMVVSVIFSGPKFITPQFKSVAVLYPYNIKSISEESETEQMVEVFQSNDIKLNVIEKENLYKHYCIDTTYQFYYTEIMAEYNTNISINKNSNEAVEIIVYDKDPQKACSIVNTIINAYNELFLSISQEKAKQEFEVYLKATKENIKELNQAAKELTEFRTKYGLLDMKAQLKNSSTDKNLIKNWQEHGAEYALLDSIYNSFLNKQSTYNKIILDNKRNMNAIKDYCRIISKPYPADRKSKPVRWVIVLLSILGSFTAGLISVSVLEMYKNK